jgi:hypothetical protein
MKDKISAFMLLIFIWLIFGFMLCAIILNGIKTTEDAILVGLVSLSVILTTIRAIITLLYRE